MGFLLFIVVFAGIFGGIAYYRSRQRQARAQAVVALAQSIGFTYSREDGDRIGDLPFRLFGKGSGRKVQLVIAGVHDGVPMRMFDYQYYVSNGRSRQYYRYTCALATIQFACPRLHVEHEDLASRIGEHLGMHDVELEFDDFNRRFRVLCDDQKFAFSMLDGGMMQWLLAADTFESFEVDGPWVLMVCKQRAPAGWLELGSWIEQFYRKVPPVVYTLYPPR